jgi:hypothetical protein
MERAMTKIIPADEADEHGVITGYILLVEWQYHLGGTPGGNRIYSSVEDLKRNEEVWEEWGIAKVEVRAVEVVVGY